MEEIERIRDHLKSISASGKYDSPDAEREISDIFDSLDNIEFTKELVTKTKIGIAVAPFRSKPKNSNIKKKADEIFQKFLSITRNGSANAKKMENVKEENIEEMKKKHIRFLKAELLKDAAKETKLKPKAVAKEIEEEITKMPSPRDTFTFLIGALSDSNRNSEFRLKERLLDGTLSPVEFVHLTPENLVTKKEQELDEKLKAEYMNKAMVPKALPTESAFFKCKRCKSNKVSFYQLQTRSADEPMTNFCHCQECGHEWRE